MWIMVKFGIKMKLLFVENTANVSHNLARRLRAEGHNVTLLTRYNPWAGARATKRSKEDRFSN